MTRSCHALELYWPIVRSIVESRLYDDELQSEAYALLRFTSATASKEEIRMQTITICRRVRKGGYRLTAGGKRGKQQIKPELTSFPKEEPSVPENPPTWIPEMHTLLSVLTDYQQRIALHLAEGLSQSETARQMGVSKYKIHRECKQIGQQILQRI